MLNIVVIVKVFCLENDYDSHVSISQMNDSDSLKPGGGGSRGFTFMEEALDAPLNDGHI